MKNLLLIGILNVLFLTSCADLGLDNNTSNSGSGCTIQMKDITLQQLDNTIPTYTVKDAVICSDMAHVSVEFINDEQNYFRINNKSKDSFNMNNMINIGDRVDFTFSTSEEALTVTEPIQASL